MKKILILLVSMIILSSGVLAYGTLVDEANIGGGAIADRGHGIQGWCDVIEPSGSNYGGLASRDDNTARPVWCEYVKRGRTKIKDKNYAYVNLKDRRHLPFYKKLPKTIVIESLDGIADDSFQVKLNGKLVYWYNDQHNTETWVTHEIPMDKRRSRYRIKIIATGEKWGGFSTYGQLVISSVKLYA